MRTALAIVLLVLSQSAVAQLAQPLGNDGPPLTKQTPPPGGWKPAPEHQGGRNLFAPSMTAKPAIMKNQDQKK